MRTRRFVIDRATMEEIRAAYAGGTSVKECMLRFNIRMSYHLMLRRMKEAGIAIRLRGPIGRVDRTPHERSIGEVHNLVEHYVPRRAAVDYLPVSSFAFPSQKEARKRAMAGR